MAVRVRNVWTEPFPVGTRVAITDRCRSWLAAGGVTVVDAWSTADQAAVGQDVVGGRVLVGDLDPWESRLVYFKVHVSAARVRKHQVEVAVVDPVAEDLGHVNRRARAPISVSRTTYDSARGVFVAECDRGTLTMAVKELVVDYNTLKRAIGRARYLLGQGGTGPGPRRRRRRRRWAGARVHPAGAGTPAPAAARVPRGQGRRHLRDLAPAAVLLWGGGWGGPGDGDRGDGGDWTKEGSSGLEFFAWPTVFDYRVDYRPEFEGQFGPIPYDDPWWKVLLLIIAAILALGAFVSAAADLANRSADTVIGTVRRSTQKRDPLHSAPAPGARDHGLR